MAPDVIRERIYIETMERVLGSVNKVIIDQNGTGANGNAAGVLPVLPLNDAAPAATRQGNTR